MTDWLGIAFARPSALWVLLALPVVAITGYALGVHRRGLPKLAVPLRVLSLALLILALAEPLRVQGSGASSLVFVVDRSKSISDDSARHIEEWISRALGSAGNQDRAAIVTFGSSPVVAAPATRATSLGTAWEEAQPPDREYTNIESALALARTLPLGSRRIVLISDGAENIGAALNQAGQAAADGTPIDVLPVPGVSEGDLRIESVVAPSAVWQGDTVTVVASVATAAGGAGTISLEVDGTAQAQPQETTFPPGLSSHTFEVTRLSSGFHTLTVRVSGDPSIDRYPENNAFPLAIVVRGGPKLLLVVPRGADPGLLRGAFERRGADVTIVEPAEVPSRLSDLGTYDAVILNNVPANALSLDQLTALREATKSLGRGLVVLGGTSSYGPGNYAGTVLEESLPVTVKVTDGRERQRVAVLLIMDKSGSMSYDPLGGTSKIDMAKEAVRIAAQSLANGDEVGILVFNDQQQWIFPIMTIEGQETRDAINAAVEQITADGGTEIYPALNVGFDAISKTDADVRHIVLLSDGKSRTGTEESYRRLIEEMTQQRTTLSTIAIGDDADTNLLQNLAEWGNGRYHFTERPEDIPRITLAEAQSAGSQSIIRGEFSPIQTRPSPIMQGFAPEDLPPLQGYDFAEAKPDAQVILTSTRNDPVLAKWQLGLGRVVAWTADDGTDFAIGWPQWERYDEFWANVVRWALPDPENRPLQAGTERQGTEVVVTVTAIGDDRDYVNNAPTWATVTSPSGGVSTDIPLYQSGPGEYQFRVNAPEPGAYAIQLRQVRSTGTIEELTGFAVPPSPELQPAPDGRAFLAAIAQRTGGRVLSLDDPGAVFAASAGPGTPLRDYQPVWFVPLGLALVLLLAELAVRLEFIPRLRGLGLWPRRIA
jgi:Mg-chelatase subunit ChlD